MKHYYDDDGLLQFDQNRQLLVELAEAYNIGKIYDRTTWPQMRIELNDKASAVIQSYSIRVTLGPIGGLTLDQWTTQPDTDPVELVLRKMLLDFVNKGFVYNEFMLVVWAAACELQISTITWKDD